MKFYFLKRIQNDFKDVVGNFNKLCDSRAYYAQYTILFWLFQQDPNLGRLFIESANAMTTKGNNTMNLDDEQQNVQLNCESEISRQDMTFHTPQKITDTFCSYDDEYLTPDERSYYE